MKRERVQKQKVVTREPAPQAQDVANKQGLKDDLDALLDEVDEALGENLGMAEEFVASYQQKGGQ